MHRRKVSGRKERKRIIMPSLVATTSASARTNFMHTHLVHARSDIVATNLGIILSSFSSFHACTSKPEGGQRTGAKQICFFWLALAGGVSVLWVSEYPSRRTHISISH